jgi:hypothetical protein
MESRSAYAIASDGLFGDGLVLGITETKAH